MWFRPPGIILTVWWGCGVLACLLACMQAGFRGWCRAVCGPLLGGGSRVRVLVVLAVLGRLLGLLPGCFPLPVPCPVLVLVGRCVCLSWPLACPRCSWCFPRWWPACRGACMHACMRVSGGAPRGACGGRVRRCAGLGLWGAPWGAARPFLACSGAVLGRFWGVVWPGVPPRCRLEAGGGGCWGFCRGRVRVLRGRGARGRASRGP